MNVVVDASVALKWFYEKAQSIGNIQLISSFTL